MSGSRYQSSRASLLGYGHQAVEKKSKISSRGAKDIDTHAQSMFQCVQFPYAKLVAIKKVGE
jgi:hypothetical protein